MYVCRHTPTSLARTLNHECIHMNAQTIKNVHTYVRTYAHTQYMYNCAHYKSISIHRGTPKKRYEREDGRGGINSTLATYVVVCTHNIVQ